MKSKIIIIFAVLVSIFAFFSCKNKEKSFDFISLDNCASWASATKEDTIQDAQNLDFKQLALKYCNLRDLVGSKENYVWIKFEFTVPPELEGKELGVVFPYINFADKAWCNGYFIGETGEFPPYQYSSLYKAHFYPISKEILNQDTKNTIFLKVLSLGNGSVTDGILIAEFDRANFYANRKNFYNSKIYLIFEGILIAAFLFLFFFYFASKTKYMLHFSFSCLSTFLFLAFFNGLDWPNYGNKIISFELFSKFTLFYGFYFSAYCISNFIFDFLGLAQPKAFKIVKNILLIITSVFTLFIPDYQKLLTFFVPTAIIHSGLLLTANILIIINVKKVKNKKQIFYMIIGFLPILICLFIDFIVRRILHNINHPFIMIFGWEITVSFFILFLSFDYSKLFVQNTKIKKDLQKQVEQRTANLTAANEKLLYENIRAQKDLDMASIVQQKFFTHPEKIVDNWEIGLLYEPLEKVSGDLYDFYIKNGVLNGFSLFDASGHGIAAALITMLSKNIIYKAFRHCYDQNRTVSSALREVNDNIIKAKGGIENYLTGIMLRFSKIDENSSKIELASAGHPYPVLYSAKDDKIINLKDFEKEARFGAIGMEGIEVSFVDIDFVMNKGDILVAFSDGIIELSDENRNSFGRKRLETLITENKNLPVKEILEVLKSQSQKFRGNTMRDDDLTVIILRKI